MQRSLLRSELPQDDGKPWTRRRYQLEAAKATFEKFERHDSTMVVLATGLGKTYLAGKGVILPWLRENRGDVLWVTHLDTLVTQAIDDLQTMLGIRVGREQADLSWQEDERVCVASVASLYRDGRLNDVKRRNPTLVIVDEGHHYPSRKNRSVVEKLGKGAKTLFLTATPIRADGVGMHNVCESVAYEYHMRDGIDDGYLVPFEVATARIAGMDYAHLKRSDFTPDKIEGIQSNDSVLAGIRRETIELAKGRQTVMFWTGVHVAHLGAQVFNDPRLGPVGSSIAVDGTRMDADEKRKRISAFSAGEFQYLHNVGVIREGFNDKKIAAIGMVAPCESFSLYAQEIGRGSRPDCDVDAYDTAEERRAAIARSSKPNCLVIDYVGNSGKHAKRLVTAIDVLAGKDADDDVKSRAKSMVESAQLAPDEAIARARAEVEKERHDEAERVAKAKAAQFEWQRSNPFADADDAPMVHDVITVSPVEPEQVRALKKAGFSEKDLRTLRDRRHASVILKQLRDRAKLGLASFKMVRALKKVGIDARQFSQVTARRIMAHMIAERTATGREYLVAPDRSVVAAAMRAEPGSDWGE